MWGKSKEIKDHVANPRGEGDLANPDAAAVLEGKDQRIAYEIYFRIHRDGRILAMRYKVLIRNAALPILSALSELIENKTLAAVKKLTVRDLDKVLGGLNKKRRDEADRILHEMARSFNRYEEKQSIRLNAAEEGFYLCTCYSVTDVVIRDAIKKYDLSTVEEVSARCNAGGGCETCHPEISGMLEAWQEMKKHK